MLCGIFILFLYGDSYFFFTFITYIRRENRDIFIGRRMGKSKISFRAMSVVFKFCIKTGFSFVELKARLEHFYDYSH